MTRIHSIDQARIRSLPSLATQAAAQAHAPMRAVQAPVSMRADGLHILPIAAQLTAARIADASAGLQEGPTIRLQSFYPIYEAYGSRTVGVGSKGVETAVETVRLSGHSAYTIATAFGLSDKRGEMRVEVKDASDTTIRAILAGTGSTRATLSLMPEESGTFTISLTGQKIAGTNETARIYGSYQIAVSQEPMADAESEPPVERPSLNLTL